MSKKNKQTNITCVKSAQPRYIIQYENVFDALDVYERSVYEALRFYADFSKPCSGVQMTIKELCIKSKIKRRKVFYVLNQLESIHFLIKRTNWENGNYGETNVYEVAHYLNYFKPVEKLTDKPPEIEQESLCKKDDAQDLNDNINGSYIEGMHKVHRVVREVHTVAQESKSQAEQGQSPFETFWDLYPIKKNKKRAVQIWRAHNLDKIADDILRRLVIQIEHDDDWLRGFAPHPTSYLNGERWNDEITKSQNAVKKESIATKNTTKPSNQILYSQFINELKAMKQFNEIPASTIMPTFEEWIKKGMTIDAQAFRRGLGS